MNVSLDNLPRLLYCSAVPPENSFHGSVLLYRLFENYPPGKLLVVESNLFPSRSERRLPGVRYETLREGNPRLLHTRFARFYRTWLTATAAARAGRLSRLLGDFKPDAMLTVGYYFSWITAARFAAAHALPLHFILHDEYIETQFVFDFLKPRLHRTFESIYRAAASRMCVSPYMVEEYERKYGAAGDVLYPSRASDAKVFGTLPDRLLQSCDGAELSVAFGGTVGSAGTLRVLRLVAEALQSINGTLKIFGPFNPAHARANGLNTTNIEFKGSLSPDVFKEALRSEADVLLAPMNFAADDATNARVSFPSKLADYTSVGLPVFVIGPDYCSGARWAKDNAPIAELVTTENGTEIRAALDRLRVREHRLTLARAALEKGNSFFSHSVAEAAFFRHLQKHVAQKNDPPLALVPAQASGRLCPKA